MSTSSLLKKLREQTATQHQQVESSAIMSRLMQRDLTADDYLAALLILAGFVGRYEKSLVSAFTKHSGYSYRPRLSLLHTDIDAIEQKAVPAAEPGQLVLDHSWHKLIGVAYVMEGSTQGGKILAQRIARQLGPSAGLTATRGLSYFNLYHKHGWDEFISWLSGLELSAGQQEEVVSGAKSAFQILADDLTGASFDTSLLNGVRG